MQETAKFMARAPVDRADQIVGEPIVQLLETGKYEPTVSIRYSSLPGEGEEAQERTDAVDAVRDVPKDAAGRPDEMAEVKNYRLNYEDTSRVGFYMLKPQAFDKEDHSQLYAVNLEPGEGELSRTDAERFAARLDGDRITRANLQPTIESSVVGARTEMWFYLLIAVGACLAIEQALAWWFGSRRK